MIITISCCTGVSALTSLYRGLSISASLGHRTTITIIKIALFHHQHHQHPHHHQHPTCSSDMLSSAICSAFFISSSAAFLFAASFAAFLSAFFCFLCEIVSIRICNFSRFKPPFAGSSPFCPSSSSPLLLVLLLLLLLSALLLLLLWWWESTSPG